MFAQHYSIKSNCWETTSHYNDRQFSRCCAEFKWKQNEQLVTFQAFPLTCIIRTVWYCVPVRDYLLQVTPTAKSRQTNKQRNQQRIILNERNENLKLKTIHHYSSSSKFIKILYPHTTTATVSTDCKSPVKLIATV